MRAHLIKELYVEAAHRNPRGGEAQRRLHGHSYRIAMLARGEPSADVGWVVDFAELKRLIAPVAAQLDHAYLNEIPGLEEDTRLPALRDWIERSMGILPINHEQEPRAARPAWFAGVRVAIHGDLAFAPRRLPADLIDDLPARIAFTFEAAQSLPQLPEGHPCRRMHGHSYRIEAAAEDLDGLEPILAALYDRLDHQRLNEVPGLETATVEHLCAYLWAWMRDRGARPTAVVVQETPSSRCVYYGE